MRLITCTSKDSDIPGPIHLHPCAKAIDALDTAGHSYDLETVEGFRMLPWTMKGKRDAIKELTGQSLVPVLVLDDGTIINGSGKIAAWARENAPVAA